MGIKKADMIKARGVIYTPAWLADLVLSPDGAAAGTQAAARAGKWVNAWKLAKVKVGDALRLDGPEPGAATVSQPGGSNAAAKES